MMIGTRTIVAPNFAETGLVCGHLPNVRRLITPDYGYDLIDMDLSRADAQVVAWEANETAMKQALRDGLDLHLFNASNAFDLNLHRDDMLEGEAGTPQNKHYKEMVKQHYDERQKCKMGGHATNYGGQAYTIAKALGVSVREGENFIARWFSTYPGIKNWHNSVRNQIFSTRTISNKFGFRYIFLDRIEDCFEEALAWVPQSTVGLVINHALCNIAENLPEVELLLQVHDSLTMQTLFADTARLLPLIKQQSEIIIPYDDPLIIPVGFSLSKKSWGDIS